MKILGIIGGMSFESSALYYQLINQAVNKQLGKNHSAKIVLISVDFEPIVQQQKLGDWHASAAVLSEKAINLLNAGVDGVLLATNTMHKVADDITDAMTAHTKDIDNTSSTSEKPFLHIVRCMADKLSKDKITKVGLLGTEFTMQDGFYHQLLENRGIDVVTPTLAMQSNLHSIIFDELCHGTIKESSRNTFVKAIEELKQLDAQAVILGCTEIGLLINEDNSSLSVYDSTLVHVEKAVEWMLAEIINQ